MPRTRNPRRGSMQYWPRKRAKKQIARIRTPTLSKDVKPLVFAGFKVGMTHVLAVDNKPHTDTKNTEIFMPATVVECPPLKVFGVVFYKKTPYGLVRSAVVFSPQVDKDLARKIPLPKKASNLNAINPVDYHDVRLLLYTQPKLTSIGRKKPDLFEATVGGASVAEKVAYAKTVLTKEISVKDVLSEGSQVDTHAVSKGHGLRGPVQRFGIQIRFHKSEKTKRGPGSLGPWHGQKTYRVAHAGQTGYHLRTELNKWILKIDNDGKKVNPVGGWLRYGNVTNEYLVLKGSLPGPSKRLITFTLAQRPNPKTPKSPPQINYLSTVSRQ